MRSVQHRDVASSDLIRTIWRCQVAMRRDHHRRIGADRGVCHFCTAFLDGVASDHRSQ